MNTFANLFLQMLLPLAGASVPVAPTAIITAPDVIPAGMVVTFSGQDSSGTNPQGIAADIFGIRNYAWSFGDGSKASGALSSVIEKQFPTPGTSTVNLTVTDYLGRTATASKSFVVTRANTIAISSALTDAVLLDALARAASSPRPVIVELPPGKFTLSSPITVPSDVFIIGRGAASTTIVNKLYGAYVLTVASGSQNVLLSDFQIIGDGVGATSTYGNSNLGINILNAKNVSLRNLTLKKMMVAANFSNSSGHVFNNYITQNGRYAATGTAPGGFGGGIWINNGGYIDVSKSYFSHNLQSISANGATANEIRDVGYDLSASRFTTDIWNSIDTHPGAGGRIRIIGNVLNGGAYAVALQNGWGEMTGNTMNNFSSYGLKLGPLYNNAVLISGAGVHDFMIENNAMNNVKNHLWLFDWGLNVSVNCTLLTGPKPAPPTLVNGVYSQKGITQQIAWNACL
jgi:hypothetical protein